MLHYSGPKIPRKHFPPLLNHLTRCFPIQMDFFIRSPFIQTNPTSRIPPSNLPNEKRTHLRKTSRKTSHHRPFTIRPTEPRMPYSKRPSQHTIPILTRKTKILIQIHHRRIRPLQKIYP